jgi:hypothetical protein
MEILEALQIARREWRNIRTSLEKCGDIGEFDSRNPVNSSPSPVEGSLLVKNLIGMENKLSTYGYLTPEAAYVFTILASSAGEQLGLIGRLAQTFGSGYSLVRTGCLNSNGTENQRIKQMIFFKLFFSLERNLDLRWDFNSPVVKVKLKTIFDKFVQWQDNPKSYIQDVRNYKDRIEPFLSGSSLALGFSRKSHSIEKFNKEGGERK